MSTFTKITNESYAAGMKNFSDHYSAQQTKAEMVLAQVVAALGKKHGSKFVDYLARYGKEAFSEDLIELFQSYVVVTRRLTGEEFIGWVEQQFLDNLRLKGWPTREL